MTENGKRKALREEMLANLLAQASDEGAQLDTLRAIVEEDQ